MFSTALNGVTSHIHVRWLGILRVNAQHLDLNVSGNKLERGIEDGDVATATGGLNNLVDAKFQNILRSIALQDFVVDPFTQHLLSLFNRSRIRGFHE